jgi:hypothetical protein
MRIILALVLLISSSEAFAKSGFVKLADGHEVFVDHQPAKAGKPTFVLVNGLVYHMERWSDFSAPLARDGFGIVRYYFRGQMDTLRKELSPGVFVRPREFLQYLRAA